MHEKTVILHNMGFVIKNAMFWCIKSQLSSDGDNQTQRRLPTGWINHPTSLFSLMKDFPDLVCSSTVQHVFCAVGADKRAPPSGLSESLSHCRCSSPKLWIADTVVVVVVNVWQPAPCVFVFACFSCVSVPCSQTSCHVPKFVCVFIIITPISPPTPLPCRHCEHCSSWWESHYDLCVQFLPCILWSSEGTLWPWLLPPPLPPSLLLHCLTSKPSP